MINLKKKNQKGNCCFENELLTLWVKIVKCRRNFFRTFLFRKELAQLLAEANEKNIKLVYKSRPILDRLSGGRPHQVIIFVVRGNFVFNLFIKKTK